MSNASDFIIENGVLKKYVGPGGDVIIPEGVTGISLQATLDLRKVGLVTSLVFPNSLTDITNIKLYCLDNVENIYFGETISRINYKAFVDDELSFWWHFDPAVDRSGEISWCRKLKNIDVAPQNKTFTVEDGVLFSKNKKKLVLCPSAREFYAVPDGVTHIMSGAFCSALRLKMLLLPDSVTNIAGDAIRFTGIEYLRLPRAVEKLAKKATDVPYVAIYHAAIADSVKYPIYLGGSIDDLPVKMRNSAVVGFFYALRNEISEIEQFEDSYVTYISRNIKTYCKQALTDEFILLWLIQKSLIPAEELHKMIKEAGNLDRPDVVAALLNYQNEKFGHKDDVLFLDLALTESEHMRKVLQRREMVKNQVGIEGLIFVVTGEMMQFGAYNEYLGIWDYSDLKKYIESNGGFLRSAVSLQTDYLISNDLNSKSRKMMMAQELSIPIISEREFLDLCIK